MMVRRMFRDIPSELCNFDFTLKLALDTAKQDLALGRFESVKNVGDGADIVILRKENVFLVDKVRVLDTLVLDLGVVEVGVLGESVEPLFTALKRKKQTKV